LNAKVIASVADGGELLRAKELRAKNFTQMGRLSSKNRENLRKTTLLPLKPVPSISNLDALKPYDEPFARN
jgi:hypothetical protein